jgi:hypothetical protein
MRNCPRPTRPCKASLGVAASRQSAAILEMGGQRMQRSVEAPLRGVETNWLRRLASPFHSRDFAVHQRVCVIHTHRWTANTDGIAFNTHRCVVNMVKIAFNTHRCVVNMDKIAFNMHRCVANTDGIAFNMHRCVVNMDRIAVNMDGIAFNTSQCNFVPHERQVLPGPAGIFGCGGGHQELRQGIRRGAEQPRRSPAGAAREAIPSRCFRQSGLRQNLSPIQKTDRALGIAGLFSVHIGLVKTK